jgi:hypothetical protein
LPESLRGPALPAIRLLEGAWRDGFDFAATVAVAGKDAVFRKLTIETTGGVADVESDTLALAPYSVQGIPILMVLGSQAGSARTCLLAGSGGLFRSIEERADGSLRETPHSTSVSPYPTSYGDGWIGMSDGSVAQLAIESGRPALKNNGRPHGQAILRIDGETALLRGGKFLVYREGEWRGPYGPNGQEGLPVGAVLRRDLEGTYLDAFLEAGGTVVTRSGLLGDQPGRILRATAGVVPPAADSVVRYQGNAPLRLDLLLVDEDANGDAPEVRLQSHGAEEDLAPGFVKADPLIGTGRIPGCAATGKCVSGTITPLTLELTRDSVIISLPILEGTWGMDDRFCMTAYFTGRQGVHRAAAAWASGGIVAIRFGGQAMTVTHGSRAALASSAKPRPAGAAREAGPASRFLSGDGRAYDASGKRLRYVTP